MSTTLVTNVESQARTKEPRLARIPWGDPGLRINKQQKSTGYLSLSQILANT